MPRRKAKEGRRRRHTKATSKGSEVTRLRRELAQLKKEREAKHGYSKEQVGEIKVSKCW